MSRNVTKEKIIPIMLRCPASKVNILDRMRGDYKSRNKQIRQILDDYLSEMEDKTIEVRAEAPTRPKLAPTAQFFFRTQPQPLNTQQSRMELVI